MKLLEALPKISPWARKAIIHSLGMIFLVASTQFIPTRSYEVLNNSADQKQYIGLAYNLAKYGSYSLGDFSETAEPPLYGEREPLYSFLLSLDFMMSVYDLNEIDIRQLVYDGDRVYPDIIKSLKVLQRILFAATVIATLITIRCLSGSWSIAYVLAFVLTGVDVLWVRYLRVETLAALLSILFALGLWAGMVAETRTRRLLAWLGAGVMLGLLSLTKGVYQFLPPLIIVGCLILLAWTYLRRRRLETRILDGIVIALVAYAFILPWSARNYVEFNKFTISTRSASILEARAAFSDITFDEYLASIEFFSEFSGNEGFPKDHPFARRPDMKRLIHKYSDHRRINYPTFRGRNSIVPELELLQEAGHSRTGAAAIVYLRSLPVQIAMALPLSVRASNLYFREWRASNSLLRVWTELAEGTFRLLRWTFIPILLGGTLLASYRFDWPVFVALLPSCYHYGTYAALTHYIPRYNAMLIPVFLVAFSYILAVTCSWARAHLNAQAERRKASLLG